jgi:hypothetical protein
MLRLLRTAKQATREKTNFSPKKALCCAQDKTFGFAKKKEQQYS